MFAPSPEMVHELNNLGAAFWKFSTTMLAQTAILSALIVSLDLLFLRRQRTAVRYAVWSLVIVKLILPTSLPGPLGWAGLVSPHWVGPAGTRQAEVVATKESVPLVYRLPDHATTFEDFDHVRPEAASPAPSHAITTLTIAPTVEPADAPRLHWRAILFLTWGITVCGLLLMFVRRLVQVGELIRLSSPADARLHSVFQEAQQALSVKHVPVELRISSRMECPGICGFWKPTILLPISLPEKLDRDQLRLILVHELIHWQRRDLFWIAGQSLLQIFHFYNPFVWFAGLVLTRLREYAVDEATLLATADPANRYAGTLVDVVSYSRTRSTVPALSLGVIGSKSALARRVERMLSRTLPATANLGWKGFIGVLLLGALLLPLAGRERQAGAQVAGQTEDAAQTPDAAKIVDLDDSIPDQVLQGANQALDQLSQPQNRFNGPQPADVILEAEAFPEDRLAKDGTAEALLTAAGVGEVEKDELVGIVVDVQGRPIAGAKVDAWTWYAGNETTTNEQGLFRLKGLDHRTGTQLVISHKGYSPRMYLQRRTGRKDWVVILKNDTYLEGTVIGVGGKPVPGATVRASCGPFNMDGGVMTEYSMETVSRDDGTFRLYVMPNRYDLQASASGKGVYRQTGIRVGLDEAVAHPIQLEPGVRFVARVIDSQTKQPVQGFRLFKWKPPQISGQSDENGQIVFEDLIPGQIQMQCGGGKPIRYPAFDFDVFQHGPFGRWWSPDAVHEHEQRQINDPERNWQRNFDDLTFDLELDMAPVTIFVEQGVTISGRVTNPDGKSVEGATVAPARTGTGNSLTGDTRYSVRTDKEGKYHVVLPASNDAEYNLVVHDGDYNEWRRWANGVSEPFQTKPGQVIENYNLELTKPAVIRGRVTSNGKPVADRQVRTHDFNKRENRYYDPTVRTTADGTFELKFVRPGKHYLQAHPFWMNAEDAPAGSQIVEVEAGEVLEDMELQVNPQ